jgi:hypothetical protein
MSDEQDDALGEALVFHAGHGHEKLSFKFVHGLILRLAGRYAKRMTVAVGLGRLHEGLN